MRFVLDPQGRVVPDIKRKLPGRGVWITASYEAVASSVRQKVFHRGFKKAVSADPALADDVATLLRRAALQDLSIANKAGCVIAGHAKVEKAIKASKPVALIHASDASEDGGGKLDRLGRAVWGDRLEILVCFDSEELSGAIGKLNVNHVLIAHGGAGQTFRGSAERYRSYMGPHPATGTMADTPEQEKA